jgi:hypothetical protein
MEALYGLIRTVLALASIEVTRAAVLPITQQLRHAGYGALADQLLNAGGARARIALLTEALELADPCTCPKESGHGVCDYCMQRDCDEYEESLPPQIVKSEATARDGYPLGVVTQADRSTTKEGQQWVRAEDRMFNVHPYLKTLGDVGGYGIRWEVNLNRGLDRLDPKEAEAARALGFFPCDVPPPSTDSGPNGVGDGGNSTEDPAPSTKLAGEIDFDYGMVCKGCGKTGLSEVHVPGDLCDDCYKLKAEAGTECAANAPELRSVEAEVEAAPCYLTEAQEAAIRKDLRQWDGSTKEWGFRKSYPPRLRSTEHGRRAYFVWRMTRFHAGVDMRIPAMAMAIIDGDPAEAALDQLAGQLAEQYFGTQLAAVATWVPLLGRPQ